MRLQFGIKSFVSFLFALAVSVQNANAVVDNYSCDGPCYYHKTYDLGWQMKEGETTRFTVPAGYLKTFQINGVTAAKGITATLAVYVDGKRYNTARFTNKSRTKKISISRFVDGDVELEMEEGQATLSWMSVYYDFTKVFTLRINTKLSDNKENHYVSVPQGYVRRIAVTWDDDLGDHSKAKAKLYLGDEYIGGADIPRDGETAIFDAYGAYSPGEIRIRVIKDDLWLTRIKVYYQAPLD